MAKLSCAFFGHKRFNYKPYEDDIYEAVEDLINRGVTEFYNCYSGQFDQTCARIVNELKEQYPHIKNVLVLSYIPDEKFTQPQIFDKTICLSEQAALYVYDIAQFNQKIVETVDYIVCGISRDNGDAKDACDYAKQLRVPWFDVVTDEEEFWTSRTAQDAAQSKAKRKLKDFKEAVWITVAMKKTTD